MRWIIATLLLVALIGSSTATTISGNLYREVERPPKTVRIYLYPEEEVWIDGADVTAVHVYPVYKPAGTDKYGAMLDNKEIDCWHVVVHGPGIKLRFYNKHGALEARNAILNSMGYNAPTKEEDIFQ